MELVILPDGSLRAIYGEAIELSVFGKLCITRASYVEPDAAGHWHADLSPVGGPLLGSFACRSGRTHLDGFGEKKPVSRVA